MCSLYNKATLVTVNSGLYRLIKDYKPSNCISLIPIPYLYEMHSFQVLWALLLNSMGRHGSPLSCKDLRKVAIATVCFFLLSFQLCPCGTPLHQLSLSNLARKAFQAIQRSL